MSCSKITYTECLAPLLPVVPAWSVRVALRAAYIQSGLTIHWGFCT